MSQSRIRKIFETRLAAWAAARVPPLPVLWENVRVPVEPVSPHLRAYILPAKTLSTYLEGNGRTLIGIMQISVFTGAGIGPRLAETIASDLDKLFACYDIYNDENGMEVHVMTPVSQSPAQIDGDLNMIAASFRYQCITIV